MQARGGRQLRAPPVHQCCGWLPLLCLHSLKHADRVGCCVLRAWGRGWLAFPAGRRCVLSAQDLQQACRHHCVQENRARGLWAEGEFACDDLNP